MTGSPPSEFRAPSLRRTSRLVLLVAAAVMVFAAAACTPQNDAQNLLNADRNRNGLASLPSETNLFVKAQGWAEQMAANGRISHSGTSNGLPAGWRSWGENVGCGGSLEGVETAFMNSSGHRANILGTKWTHVASGVAQGTCTTSTGFVIKNAYFVVQVFVQL